MSSAAFSAIGTSNGLTSYDETQVTSAYTGSGAISTGVLVISAATSATAIAVSATRRASSVVSTTPEAKPQEPRWITRTAKPTSSASSAVWSTPSRTAEVLVPDPLEAEVRVAGPQLLCPARGRPRRARGRGGR